MFMYANMLPIIYLLLFGFQLGAIRQCNSNSAISADQQHGDKSVEIRGMTMHWEFRADTLICRLRAETEGWVAIGFNTQKGLAKTNLIMAAVKNGEVTLSDRYIVGAGDHRSIESLGGQSKVTLIEGKEENGATEIVFEIPLESTDEWHYTLEEGQKYHLLMAYSRDDDFMHHSMMRRHPEVQL